MNIISSKILDKKMRHIVERNDSYHTGTMLFIAVHILVKEY
jgi:hypothetical protein